MVSATHHPAAPTPGSRHSSPLQTPAPINCCPAARQRDGWRENKVEDGQEPCSSHPSHLVFPLLLKSLGAVVVSHHPRQPHPPLNPLFISLRSCSERRAAMRRCMIYEALFLPGTKEKKWTGGKIPRDSHNEGAGPIEAVQTDEGTARGKVGSEGRVAVGTGWWEGDIHHPATPRLQTGSRNQVTGGAAGPDSVTSAWFIVNLTAHISLGNNFISIQRFISTTL